ncbi:MAG: SH3 domain-containing protein [Pseudomonadota bacterium]
MRSVPARLGFSLVFLGLLSIFSTLTTARAETETQVSREETRIGFSGLPVPRFVALKKEKVYGRAGPSFDVDVVVVYRRQGLPVRVIAETADDVWRRVEDHTGRKVWINKTMLMENQHAVLQSEAVLFAKPSPSAPPRARLEPGVMAKLERCEAQWCQIKTAGFRGWTTREILWGSPASYED